MEKVEKRASKIGMMKEMLLVGTTKSQIQGVTGLKMSTINCQIYYHLPQKGWEIKKDGEIFTCANIGEPKPKVKKEQEIVITEC